MTPSALVVLAVLAAPGTGTGIEIGINSYALGKRYSVTITQAALEKAPAWKDDADNPPLSARKAMRLAKSLKDKLVKDTDDWTWELESAALHLANGERWYWLVTYAVEGAPGRGRTGPIPRLRLVVLMDGTVIEPKVSEDKPR